MSLSLELRLHCHDEMLAAAVADPTGTVACVVVPNDNFTLAFVINVNDDVTFSITSIINNNISSTSWPNVVGTMHNG